ncbi:MAG: hypothetical protein EXR75_12065 [Myxococcales bacterium]|nr:hypothetical protein [Myxococcales bacterium]
MESSGSRRTLVEVALVVSSKALASLFALELGFRAVSDDDFARVVLAQQFARTPALDPTGTSWLPLPFWLTGGVMRACGDTSLAVARGTAFALGLGAALIVYAAARLLIADRRAAVAGAVVAAIFPWSARLGIATVPELPAAALSLFGIATLASNSAKHRIFGAISLLCACLCRYEPWPLAAAFAAVTLLERGPQRLSAATRRVAVSLALAGPLGWLAHNALAHGDALHFLARVSAYRRAVVGEGHVAELFAYPLALLREEPELWLMAIGGALLAARVGMSPLLMPRANRPALALAAMVALLSVAALRGGAPTHHAGRAMLAVWLAVALYGGGAIYRAVAHAGRARVAVAIIVAVSVALGACVLRPWYARLDSMADRKREIAIGQAAEALGPTARILLETRDFGYFAIQAGSGEPARFVLDRDVDPRAPAVSSSFADRGALLARVRATGATHVIGEVSTSTSQFGAPLAMHGQLGLWHVAHPTSTSAPSTSR